MVEGRSRGPEERVPANGEEARCSSREGQWRRCRRRISEEPREFYEGKLGLTPVEETEQGTRYRVGENEFLLFPSTGKASGDHTQLGFDVDDLADAVNTLRDRGVTFEEYDMPGFKSVDGIVEVEGEKSAWFKDSEGNLIVVVQPR